MQLKRQQENSNNLLHHRRSSDHRSSCSHRTEPEQIQPQNIVSPPERSQPEPWKQPNNATTIRNKQDVIAQYPESFDGIGKLQGEYHITVVPSVPLVVHPPRKVPISMKDEIRKKLNDKISGSTTLYQLWKRYYRSWMEPKYSRKGTQNAPIWTCRRRESSYLVTFISPYGLYRFQRMTFGL